MFPAYLNFFFCILATSLLACPGYCDNRVDSIGVILPLSGSLATYGEKVKKGIQLAAKEMDASSSLIYEDGQSETKDAVTAYKKLTALGKIKYIIGPFGPDQTLSIAGQALKAKVLLIALSMCDERYLKYRNVFCIYPSAVTQVEPLYREFGREGLAVNSMSVLFQNMESAEHLEPSLREFAKQNQITDFYLDRFDGQETDFRTQLVKIKSKKHELFVVGGNPKNVVQIFKQAYQLQLRPKYSWYLSEHDTDLFLNNKEALEGAYTEASPLEINSRFVAAYQKMFELEPDFYSALGYDATRFLLSVLSEPAKSLDQIVGRLISLRLKRNAIPGFHFNHDRTVSLDLAITRIENGRKIPLR